MKSERRHELQHNALADWIVNAVEEVKPYQNLVLAGVVVVLIGLLGYTWWSRESATQTSQAWDALNAVLESGNVGKLATVMEDYPNTSVAYMAAVVLADYRLGEGCNRLFTNKATARQELSKAAELYRVVLDQSRLSSLTERATFGLARATEAKGDIGPAEQLYGEVVSKWPEGAYAVAAKERLADLKRPATKTLYDDFAKFDPKPAFSDMPGEKPSFDLNSLPSEGAVATPETSKADKSGGQEKSKLEEKKAPEKAGK